MKALEEKYKINVSEDNQCFLDENYSKTPKKIVPQPKTDVYHIDDVWSLDILGIKNYGPEKNEGYRYVLV